eukprot:30326-Prymnesium_polylepis.1
MAHTPRTGRGHAHGRGRGRRRGVRRMYCARLQSSDTTIDSLTLCAPPVAVGLGRCRSDRAHT